MSFFDTLILDVIFILFSMGLILMLKCYDKIIGRVSKKYLIDIASFMMMYLLIKYSSFDNTYSVILINVPFIISILRNRKFASFLLSLIIIIFYYVHGYNLDICMIEYFLYIIIFLIMNRKGRSLNIILSIFLFIKGISLTIENFYILGTHSYFVLFKIFISLLVFYLVCMAISKIISIMENTMSLNSALKELEREKDLKNGLFKITHEVKNPIAVCMGYLSMNDYNKINEVKRHNEIIYKELNRALDIMNNFSDYNSIKVNLDIMDLDCLINDAICSSSSILKKYNVKINYDYDSELYIYGDYDRLKQVFINLFKNACEAMISGGVIDVTIEVTNKYIKVHVKDNGPGMTKDDINNIGKLFYTSKQKGCGIGVPISMEILKLHNGKLFYKSEPTKYTDAILTFPFSNSLQQ